MRNCILKYRFIAKYSDFIYEFEVGQACNIYTDLRETDYGFMKWWKTLDKLELEDKEEEHKCPIQNSHKVER